MDKKKLSESDICDRYITPAIQRNAFAAAVHRLET